MVMRSLPLPNPMERRTAERREVSCPAALCTPYARLPGELSDISTGGACFRTPDSPRPGTMAMLDWDGREFMCRVVWSKKDMCGLSFDKPLPPELVGETVETWKPAEPAAAMGNIQMGARRNRFRLATTDEPDAT
ncbi:PilZ domain-containing protein [Tsuneonella sp. HG222]